MSHNVLLQKPRYRLYIDESGDLHINFLRTLRIGTLHFWVFGFGGLMITLRLQMTLNASNEQSSVRDLTGPLFCIVPK